MKRIGIAVAGLVLSAVTALAQAPDCVEGVGRVLNVGIPRTSLSSEERERLTRTIADVLGDAYTEGCQELEISFAFGSDYEVMDWLERGSVDAAIVPDLSLWLLASLDGIQLRELNDGESSKIGLLHPLAPAPSCRHYEAGQWSDCAQSPRAAFDALLKNIAEDRPNGSTRVIFASHLSSTGFLAPIVRAVPALAKRGNSVEAREAAWAQLFDAITFAIDPSPDPFEDVLEDAKALSQLDVVFYPGEETLEGVKEPPSKSNPYREHLVISAAAGTSFSPSAFVDLSARTTPLIDPALQVLLQDLPSTQSGNRAWRRRVPPPRPLEVIAKAEPAFGIRSFSFSLHESLRLLAQQQRSSGIPELALVLPGGGVKAAYQSRIVDHLYGEHELRNFYPKLTPPNDKVLVVTSVLGTSGGALLGYFVSQLGPKGPFTLTNILWKPGGKALGGTRVFGFTDLPRYFSIAWTFFVFCVVLAIFAGRHRSPFYRRSPAQIGAWRIRLFTLFAIFLLVPVLIRLVTGGEDIEHVPVIEGLFYSILTVLVMFADQCLIYDPAQQPGQRSVHTYTIVLLLFGGAAMVTSFFGPTAALQRPVTFRFAFITLLAIFVGCPVVLLYAAGKIGDLRSRLLDVLVSVFVVMTLFAFGVQGWLPAEVPQILALLVLLILAFVVYRDAKRNVTGRFRAAGLMFLTVVSTAFLCWLHDPDVRPALHPSLSFLGSDALENTPLAPFLASTGCLLLVIGAAFWVYQSQAYRLNGDEGFAHAIILLLGHAIAAALLVFLAARLLPDSIHDLEMTGSFWVALTLFGVLAAGVILLIAPHWERARAAIEFLNGEHPNGSLVPRRYARMLAIAMISVLWWNAIVAPALYGNRSAWKYIDAAIARFDAAAAPKAPGYLPTVKFVAPTNTLDSEDATRYFLFLPPEESGTAVPRSVAGTVWSVYPTSRTPDPEFVPFVHDVVFSSGSPFPIFAAHRVKVPGDSRPLALIDGGYSNDIPIDAARTLKAQQVLIVHSSSPFGADTHERRNPGLSLSAGLLIRNVKRLPEFIFERSQQADRISRQNLFVVGLAPKVGPSDPWPGLAQFDPPTVNYLIAKAGEDIYQRIAFVESWGEPRFRVSQQVKPAGGPARRGARG